MYKLLIVDDEKKTRMGLINVIDWEEMGFMVIADFSDAIKALDYLKENFVDVILTDIKMNILSGIEFVEIIKRKYPDILVIFLSGYKDFEYAKKAVDLNVVGYLLKPVKIQEIIDIFSKVRHKLSSNYKNSKEENKHLEYIKDSFFKDIINGTINNSKVLEKIAIDINLDFLPTRYLFCLIEIVDKESWLQEEEFTKKAIRRILEPYSDENIIAHIFNESANKYIIIFDLRRNKKSLSEVTKEYIEALTKEFFYKYDLKIKASLSEIKSGYENIVVAYNEVKTANMFGVGKRNILSYGEIYNIRAADTKVSTENLHMYILQKNTEKIQEEIERIIYLLYENGKDIRYIINAITFIISNIFAQFYKDGKNKIPLDLIDYSELLSVSNISQLITKAKKLLMTIAENINNSASYDEKLKFRKVKEYIDSNYCNEEISLELIAKKMFLSPSTCSKIFKDETGENFSSYIIALRLNKAKELLRNGFKVYQVSSMIGYSSSKYFSKLFKKHTGMSPMEYKKD